MIKNGGGPGKGPGYFSICVISQLLTVYPFPGRFKKWKRLNFLGGKFVVDFGWLETSPLCSRLQFPSGCNKARMPRWEEIKKMAPLNQSKQTKEAKTNRKIYIKNKTLSTRVVPYPEGTVSWDKIWRFFYFFIDVYFRFILVRSLKECNFSHVWLHIAVSKWEAS